MGKTFALSMLAASLSVSAEQSPATAIPALTGTTLSGDKVSLPEDLHGRPGVMILGFTQASRGQATAWGKRLAIDFRDTPDIHFYEMPMLAGVPRLLRGFVVKKIAETVTENGKRHFLPVYDHESEWRAAAQFSKPDDAYIVVVDGGGIIRWRIVGALSDDADALLKQKIQELRP